MFWLQCVRANVKHDLVLMTAELQAPVVAHLRVAEHSYLDHGIPACRHQAVACPCQVHHPGHAGHEEPPL